MNKIIQFFLLLGVVVLSTGCLKVYEADTVFVIEAKKTIIGASFEDADAKIPDGATVLSVTHIRGPLLGLVQYTSITGTK